MTASEVFRLSIKRAENLTDSGWSFSCAGCANASTLAECVFQESPDPEYRCRKCSMLVLKIDKPGCGSGTRLGDWVLIPSTPLRVMGIMLPAAEPLARRQ